jgi:hypothetical protein
VDCHGLKTGGEFREDGEGGGKLERMVVVAEQDNDSNIDGNERASNLNLVAWLTSALIAAMGGRGQHGNLNSDEV